MNRRSLAALAVVVAVVTTIALSCTICCDSVKAMFYVEHMEEDARVAGLHVGEILDSLSLQPGMRVADVGAGSGLFSFEIAKHVLPDGIVYAVDINSKLIAHIESKAHEYNAGNVRAVLAVEDDPRIPETVDLIFICDTLHYIDDQPGYIKTLGRYVKPNGRIAVVDFKENWPPQSVRFSEEQIVRWMRDADLQSIGDYRFIKDEFFKIFKKVESRTPGKSQSRELYRSSGKTKAP